MDARRLPGSHELPNGNRVGWHLLDQSPADGTIQHWTPNTDIGFASQWPGVGGLGPHAMATDGSQLFLGGDFNTVNNKRSRASPSSPPARIRRLPRTRRPRRR